MQNNTNSEVHNPEHLPVEGSIKEAWSSTDGVKGSIWISLGIIIVISILYHFIHAAMLGDMSWRGLLQIQQPRPPFSVSVFIVDLIYNILYLLLASGIIYIAIRRVANLSTNWRMMFRSFHGSIALKIIGAIVIMGIFMVALILLGAIIYGVLLHIGAAKIISFLAFAIIFCVIFYLNIRWTLALPIILDRELGPWAALRLSYRSTMGNFWRLVGIKIITGLLVIASCIILGIGLIWTLPLAFCIAAVVYQKLIGIQTNQ